eukprot:GHVL01027711.1.p1 GENE.GHVL01027711.1~~GHVL01027711.1.p1  ORF type:complete len:262 (-),score=41.10 GHVL01027711.1:64-849(-)
MKPSLIYFWEDYLLKYFSKFFITFVLSIIIHHVIYYSLCLPYFLMQFFEYFEKYKIQKKKENLNDQWKCLKGILFSQMFLQVPLEIGAFFYVMHFNIPFEYEKISPFCKLAAQLFGCAVLEDTWHYFMHRLMHYGPLYKHIHKIHHDFSAPFGFEAEYAHPIETLVLGMGFMIGVLVYGNHVTFLWFWVALRLTETIEVHSGYDIALPFNWLHFFPFYGGARFHDFHHQNFIGNYASSFTYWDELFGTDKHYQQKYKKIKI